MKELIKVLGTLDISSGNAGTTSRFIRISFNGLLIKTLEALVYSLVTHGPRFRRTDSRRNSGGMKGKRRASLRLWYLVLPPPRFLLRVTFDDQSSIVSYSMIFGKYDIDCTLEFQESREQLAGLIIPAFRGFASLKKCKEGSLERNTSLC